MESPCTNLELPSRASHATPSAVPSYRQPACLLTQHASRYENLDTIGLPSYLAVFPAPCLIEINLGDRHEGAKRHVRESADRFRARDRRARSTDRSDADLVASRFGRSRFQHSAF